VPPVWAKLELKWLFALFMNVDNASKEIVGSFALFHVFIHEKSPVTQILQVHVELRYLKTNIHVSDASPLFLG
jgi:hypothetical protein